jgi:CheY-like chemotaxis protein
MKSGPLNNDEIKVVIEDFRQQPIVEQVAYTILVIDDDKWIQRLLCRLLNSWGFSTLSAMDSIEGISMAIKHRPMLIFLDIVLPDIMGDVVLKLFKTLDLTSAIPVIMLSGNLNLELLANTFKDGASGFVSKPFNEEILIEKLNECLGPTNFNKIRDEKIN